VRRITRVGKDVRFLPRRVYPYMDSSRRDEKVRLCNRNIRLGKANYAVTIQWGSPLRDKPTLTELIKNFLAIYETFKLITAFTRGRTLSQINPDHNSSFISLKSVSILSSHLRWSQESVVGIATGYGLDDTGVGVRVRGGSRIFSSPNRPDRLSGPPNLLSNEYRGLIPRG
jgi:hypothetical protein